MKQTLKTPGLVIILASMNPVMAQTDYRGAQDPIHWFSSSTSALLNRSSVALGKHRIDRGVRLAQRALAGKLNPADQFIAYHNLCLGHLATGRPEDVSQACARAFELAQRPYTIVKLRGTWRIYGSDTGEHGAQATPSPAQVMAGNILHRDTDTCLDQLNNIAPMLTDNRQPD